MAAPPTLRATDLTYILCIFTIKMTGIALCNGLIFLKTLHHHTALCVYVCALSGLDVEKDTILEMACLITDGQLNIIEEVSG